MWEKFCEIGISVSFLGVIGFEILKIPFKTKPKDSSIGEY